MQKHLTQTMEEGYPIELTSITVEHIFTELKAVFSSQPAAGARAIDFSDQNLKVRFKSDFFLLTRVLTNMIVNALEATDRGEAVKIGSIPMTGRSHFSSGTIRRLTKASSIASFNVT